MNTESRREARGDTDLALISQLFTSRLRECDIRALLAHLNGFTAHRFTGVYRFEPGWVVSLALYDREDPGALVGADVKMKESYCWLTGLGSSYVIEDATKDVRLNGHPAQHQVRSYVGVLLRDANGRSWGTLCHFDFEPRESGVGTIELLEHFRPLIEEYFVRDARSNWNLPAPSLTQQNQLVDL